MKNTKSQSVTHFKKTSSKNEIYIITHYLLYHKICQKAITKAGYWKFISVDCTKSTILYKNSNYVFILTTNIERKG